jgi:hypothetical protein
MKSKSFFSLLGVLAVAVFAFCAFLAPRETLNVLAPVAAIVCAVAFVAISPRSRRRSLTSAINIAEGTHKGSVRKLADAAIATRYLLFKFGSDVNHIAVAGANDIPLGTVDDEAAAAEDEVGVNILGSTGRTLLMVASEALTVGEAVYTAASGKVQDLPAGAGTYYQVGYAMNATSADGDVVEVQPCTPVKTVVP